MPPSRPCVAPGPQQPRCTLRMMVEEAERLLQPPLSDLAQGAQQGQAGGSALCPGLRSLRASSSLQTESGAGCLLPNRGSRVKPVGGRCPGPQSGRPQGQQPGTRSLREPRKEAWRWGRDGQGCGKRALLGLWFLEPTACTRVLFSVGPSGKATSLIFPFSYPHGHCPVSRCSRGDILKGHRLSPDAPVPGSGGSFPSKQHLLRSGEPCGGKGGERERPGRAALSL